MTFNAGVTAVVEHPHNYDASSSSSTSSSLLGRVRLHDEAAWERLVRVYGVRVLDWCRLASIRNEEDQLDVCQEVFRAVACNIDGFRHDRPEDTFRGWLRTITHSKIVDYARRRNRQPLAAGGSAARDQFLAIPDCLPDSDSDIGNNERALLAGRVMALVRNEFEERTWQAFWLTMVEEKSPSIVAQALEMTPAAVRQAKSRVLRRLREELQQTLVFEPEEHDSKATG